LVKTKTTTNINYCAGTVLN